MNEWTKQIKTIGFDVDQTLYRHTPETSRWIKEQLIEKVATKLDKQIAEVAPEYEARLAQYASNTLTLNSYNLDGEKIFQALFDEIPLERYMGRDEKLVGMIKRLRERYSLFIISNGTERQVKKKIEILGLKLADFYPVVCCYDHPGWTKPSPAAFLYVLQELRLSPEQAVYVGDKEDGDVMAAQAVGMKAVLVGDSSQIADASVASIYEVGDLFT